MNKKQKLELTWIGKENRPRLEPRILLGDPALSYHAPHRVTKEDIFDNRLIFGDNLLALKALEAEYAGKVKCVFIDPPYNTGSPFTHYDDGLEHSIWLSLMCGRACMGAGLCPGRRAGPLASVLATATSDTGTLSKLNAEAIESADRRQVEGVKATGGNRISACRPYSRSSLGRGRVHYSHDNRSRIPD